MYVSEMMNSKFRCSSPSYFNLFISWAGLKELRLGGKRYTYMCNDSLKLKKIDHFLVCLNFIRYNLFVTVTALPREFSDHSHVVLCSNVADFWSTPFRFFNSCCLEMIYTFHEKWPQCQRPKLINLFLNLYMNNFPLQ